MDKCNIRTRLWFHWNYLKITLHKKIIWKLDLKINKKIAIIQKLEIIREIFEKIYK